MDAAVHHLANHPLPAGAFTITDEENRSVLEVIGAHEPERGDAHPLWAYIATQRGIGISVGDLCALADFDINDGPMLGSVELEYLGAIEKGIPYRVEGEVVEVVRKHGRSGTFDVLTFRERLLTEAGAVVASATNTFILPRGRA